MNTMLNNMKNIEEKLNNLLQLGQIDKDLCLKFRRQSAERHLSQVKILSLLVEWWISLDVQSQRNFYFQDEPLPDALREKVEKILADHKLIKISESEHEPYSRDGIVGRSVAESKETQKSRRQGHLKPGQAD